MSWTEHADKYHHGPSLQRPGIDDIESRLAQVEMCIRDRVSDVYSATRARLSNDANIMCMGAFTTGKKVREMLVDAFFTNDFIQGCSSQPKVDAFVEYDNNR